MTTLTISVDVCPFRQLGRAVMFLETVIQYGELSNTVQCPDLIAGYGREA